MMNKRDISVIIPTRNEEVHIERCLKSALLISDQVFVVDSQSNDRTVEIAEHLGARVYQYNWTSTSNFSRKMNWALENLPITTTWAMRLDADEYLLGDWEKGLDLFLNDTNEGINGCNVYRWVYFLGRKMRHRVQNPRASTRILRVGFAFFEDRWLDEHIDLRGGGCKNLKLEFADNPNTTIDKWIDKHNVYSLKQALIEIDTEIGLNEKNKNEKFSDRNVRNIKKRKERYSKSKRYWRCFFFFIYLYIFRLGFLDGKEGFLWDFYHTWWYRTLVDTKIDEIYSKCGKDPVAIKKYVLNKYGIDYR